MAGGIDSERNSALAIFETKYSIKHSSRLDQSAGYYFAGCSPMVCRTDISYYISQSEFEFCFPPETYFYILTPARFKSFKENACLYSIIPHRITEMDFVTVSLHDFFFHTCVLYISQETCTSGLRFMSPCRDPVQKPAV